MERVFSAIYRLALLSIRQPNRKLRVLGRIAAAVRNLSLFVADPPVKLEIAPKVELKLHLSHKFPLSRQTWPQYDTALPRIAALVAKEYGVLKLIDVGANVGDTTALVAASVPGSFLCLEGDARYMQLLEENATYLANRFSSTVAVENVLLDESARRSNLKFTHAYGTSSAVELPDGEASGAIVESVTLDRLIEEKHPAFHDANVLKIDTDGYDFKVLRGAKHLLTEAKPVLFFEYSPSCLVDAKEDLFSIFPYLIELGYEWAINYCVVSCPQIDFNLRTQRDLVWKTLNFVNVRGTHSNLLVVHDSHKAYFDKLCRLEFEQERLTPEFPYRCEP
jgi:FkbM family methyltransferase